MKFEAFPNKCIKCKRSDIELQKFSYARTKRKRSSKSSSTVYLSFPVCSSCFQDFEKSSRIENLFESIRFYSIISFVIAIFLGIDIVMRSTSGFTIVLLTITAFITIVGFGLYFKLKLDPNRIKKYINLKKTGEVVIKDKEFQKEVVDHIVLNKEVEALKRATGLGMIYCPKCGSQQLKGVDYCKNCGKELRNL
ncbi:MAG: hypothetical protein ACXABO_12260 [Promethearchaeota archaeon]|jgi:uncharacterized protein (DUF983 family)